MDSEFHEALTSLEVLMSEFFAPTTSNLRKREIEGMLENFSNRRDSWKHCLLFLQKSQNQYVLMFTLTTLENIINKQWISLSDHEKTDIRQTLWNELLAKHEVMIYFIRNKLAALMVSIARYDWPHNYPDFFDNIIELIQCEGRRCLLGLVLAQAASEELGAARDTGILLPTDRRTQLERLMLKGTPQLLNALSAILEKNAQKGSSSNPPPSPTSGIPQASALPDLLANAKVADKALDMEIVVKCLTTLQHLFSWLPLSSHVPPSLVSTVFYWGSVATQTQSLEAGLAGLGGVCELLYRRYSPPASAATALRLHHAATQLLRHAPHQHAPQQYLDKFAEFLKLFVSLHFKRLEAEAEFDAMEFLSYLFQYTFQVPTCTTFVNCLDIWIQFMDILKPEDTAKYWEALRGLVNGVLNKIQFQHNKAQLQHLDNDVCDDDGETEWQTFLRHCIECIARVAEMVPLEVFEIVLERWRCLQDVHARASSRASASSGADGDRLLAALVDLATLTRVLGRLAPHTVTEAAGRAAGLSVIDRGAGILNSVILSRPYRQPTANTAAHTHLEAEVVACMGAWARYAAQCGAAPRTLDSLLVCAAHFLRTRDPQEPPLLCHAAAHLLLSIAKNVKFTDDPIKLLEELYTQAQRSLHYLEPKTAAVVREALLTLALSRGSGGVGACGNEAVARALLAAWCGALVTAGPTAALPPLTHALLAFQHAPTHTKQILAEGILGTAQTALRMLCEPSYALAEPEITDFFLALFTTVLQQMGDFTYNAIDCFLEVAQRGGSESSASRLVECVRLGVETESGARRVRVGLVLQLCAPPLARAAAKLLASVLIHRWRYFFPTKLLEEGEEARRMDELRTALSTLGQSLLDGDIEVFRTAIETLDVLNTKWRLYHRAIFRTEFLAEFLSVLLVSVSERGGGRALYREEVLSAIHAMSAVDFVAFRSAFLPHFLSSMQGLTQEQVQHLAQFPADTDLPTFTQNIQRLMNDVNCYRAYSSLLPTQMPMPT